MPLRVETVVLAPRHRAEVLVLLRRQQQKTLFSPETENEVLRSSSEPTDQSFARTAGTRGRRRFSQTTRAICSTVQIRRMEVRVQDVFADHDDTELNLR